MTGGSATITNTYSPARIPETGTTASFQVNKTDGADTKLQGAVFTVDSATGLCTAVERLDIR